MDYNGNNDRDDGLNESMAGLLAGRMVAKFNDEYFVFGVRDRVCISVAKWFILTTPGTIVEIRAKCRVRPDAVKGGMLNRKNVGCTMILSFAYDRPTRDRTEQIHKLINSQDRPKGEDTPANKEQDEFGLDIEW